MLNIEQIRKHFPALNRMYNGKQAIYLDGPGGSQVVDKAIEAMVGYMSSGVANLHGEFPTSKETENHFVNARSAIADLVGAKPEEVAFGQNSTSLMFTVARALSISWTAEHNIVLTEMDHRSNVDSWLTAAQNKNTEVRFIPVDPETLTLDLTKLDELIDERTKLVAVTSASNAVGTISDVQKISARAREVGALVAVDAVHAVPHYFVDRDEIGADLLFFSIYKFFGPHIGVAVIKEDVFDVLPVYKLQPAPTNYPDKLETGTQNHEAIAALEATVDFIASFGKGDNRKEKLKNAYQLFEIHENNLADKMRTGLTAISEISLYNAPTNTPKTPTIAFTIEGAEPVDVCKWLAENHAIFIASGDFYASTLAVKLGIDKTGGWIRAGLAPYNTEEEVELFLEAVKAYVSFSKKKNLIEAVVN